MLIEIILTLLLHELHGQRIKLNEERPAANSPISFSPAPLTAANYSLVLKDKETCRFASSIIPCDCVMRSGEGYELREDGNALLSNISISAPRVSFTLPKVHEMLQEITIAVVSKLCVKQSFSFRLFFRPLEVMPFDESPWSLVHSIDIILHDLPVSLILPCDLFYRRGLYALKALSEHGDEIETDQTTSVQRGGKIDLHPPPAQSIFPSCTDEFTLQWTPPSCRPTKLSNRLRISTVDQRGIEDYAEEAMLDPSSSSFSLPCSYFDILNLQYCFELASIHMDSHSFHQWGTACVSTEPRFDEKAEWTEWSEWSACSNPCGKGITRRTRACSVVFSTACPPGDVSQTAECTAYNTTECVFPSAASLSSLNTSSSSSSCLCGCTLRERAASLFIAPSRLIGICDQLRNHTTNNLTMRKHLEWRIPKQSSSTLIDAVVTVERVEGAGEGRLLIYEGDAYEKLVWMSDSRRDRKRKRNKKLMLTLPIAERDVVVVYEPPSEGEKGAIWSIHYVLTETPSPPLSLSSPSSPLCSSPACTEYLPVLLLIGFVLLLLLSLPPLICAALTRRTSRMKEKRRAQDEAALLTGSDVDPMLRSGNTECTQVSVHRPAPGVRMVSKRSIGIQLSVQSTPRLPRHWPPSSDSPLTTVRGGSSLSNMEELEYDEYDGTLMPGSLFRPPDLHTDCIDIEQIIAEAERVVSGVEIERVTAGTQADE